MLTREQVEQIRQRFEHGYAKPCYYDHGTQPAGMFIDHTEAFRDLKDMLAHDAEQRQTIEAQAQRIKELVAFYDKYVGTPCERIRHKQQVDALMERIAELEAALERQQDESR